MRLGWPGVMDPQPFLPRIVAPTVSLAPLLLINSSREELLRFSCGKIAYPRQMPLILRAHIPAQCELALKPGPKNTDWFTLALVGLLAGYSIAAGAAGNSASIS